VDGFVDRSSGGVTELRVHGVSATPPDSMLENPHVTSVSGDSTAGFYRRIWLGGEPSRSLTYADIPNKRRREAYSWGGLTSGASSRALWMLLLPFMLANVAFWMYPAATLPPGEEPRWRSPARDFAAALQRLFSLSLTVALTLSAVDVATDFAGWQCGGSRSCVAQNSFLHFFTLSFFRQPGHRLALATVIPVAVVVLLWVLGQKSWNAYERLQPPARDGVTDGDRSPTSAIGRRRMWNGAEPVRRMRSLHVCAGFATAGIFLTAPLTSGSHGGAGVTILLVVMLFALAGPVLALLVPGLWRRQDPAEGTADDEPRLSPDRHDLWKWLPWAALVLVATGVVVALFANAGPAISTGPLPWLSSFLGWVLLTQIALLMLIVLIVSAVAIGSRKATLSPGAPRQTELRGRALAGLAAPVMLLLSWVLAVSFAAGLVLRSADFLGTPIPVDRPVPVGKPVAGQAVLLVPNVYYWAAACAFCLVLVSGLVAAVVFALVSRHAKKRGKDLVAQTYVDELSEQAGVVASIQARAHMIARVWARARLIDDAPLLLTILASVLTVAVAAAVVGYLTTSTVNGSAVHGLWLWQHASWLATAGSWAVGAVVVALIALGRRAYSDPSTRRTVGILWDLGTFWPRATHPLAPPCYCERTLPDLTYRMTWLAPSDADLVVLSTHSQGTVIGAALVLQLDKTQRARTAFITYGSPLQRLYSRFFPAYFGPEVLAHIGEALAETAPAQGFDRAFWPWRNLFRASDPIGGPIHHPYPADESLYRADIIAGVINGRPPGGDNNDVDRQFLDPLFNPAAGNTAYPQTLGHSGYFDDPYFPACVDKVIQLARQRRTIAAEQH